MDVSGSMEDPFSRQYNLSMNKEKIHTIFSTLEIITKLSSSFAKVDMFATLFGLDNERSPLCDFLEIFRFIHQFFVDPGIRGIEISSLTNLLKRNGADYIETWMKGVGPKLCNFIYHQLILHPYEIEKLIDSLPPQCKYAIASLSTSWVVSKKSIECSAIEKATEVFRDFLNYFNLREIFEERFNESRIESIWKIAEMSRDLTGLIDEVQNLPVSHNLKSIWIDRLTPFIYGCTPMVQAFQKAFEVMEKFKNLYQDKVLFVITDGNSTDGNPKEMVLSMKEQTQTLIVSCMLTINDIESPRRLYDTCPSSLTEYEKNLFLLSSVVSIDSPAFSILLKYHWKLPPSGECRLFAQINNPNVLEEFTEIISVLCTSNDALLDIIGNVDMKKYIQNTNQSFPVQNQGKEGTCYAHACGTVIHLTLSQIYGRLTPSFEKIKQDLIEEYCITHPLTKDILKIELPKYKLHFKEVTEKWARKAIQQKRTIVARFQMMEKNWDRFYSFYRNHPNEILTKEVFKDVDSTEPNSIAGHAVVLVRCNPSCLTFMNSWGPKWGDKGFFHVKDSEVLGIEFFDAQWHLEDLTPTEQSAWKNRNDNLVKNYFLSHEQIREIHEIQVKCPSCCSFSQAQQYTGTCFLCRCPICSYEFEPTINQLSQCLYMHQ
jgi:uncharacterized protein YegL